ncbi:MAG: glycine cleavage system aminomethyltransferase GcvT [Rhodocyclaceae bacterium]|nr:glycine cleavage system aminomethyltransferase GcvT [Rhodocyclaceae bacterium]
MSKQTPLHRAHVDAGARMVDFAGWEMPVNYGSQIEEHHAVRRHAGMFDVSHMLAIDVTGGDGRKFLRTLLANDVAKLTAPGQALYTCMLNPTGGVIDDLIVYHFADDRYRLVVNAGSADKDVAWMRERIDRDGADVDLAPRRDLAMIAVQGPQARRLCWQAIVGSEAASEALSPFQAVEFGELVIARTGYTGEDGFELTVPASRAVSLWRELADAGVAPCGLGARDTLRLEAGMNLYGQDMDEDTSPLDAGLAWTIDFKDQSRHFVGREPLENSGARRRMLGLVLEDKGVLRAHMKVTTEHGDGVTTSGSFSPTLQKAIAFARLPLAVAPGEHVTVDIRGRMADARAVKLPFVRKGQSLV